MYYTPVDYDLATHYCAMWRSEDRGRTWGAESRMSWPGQFLAQPTVVRLNATALRAYFRDRRGRRVHFSDSLDNGASWPAQPKRSKLPNNQSGIQVRPAGGILGSR